jgi:hypothetical protein
VRENSARIVGRAIGADSEKKNKKNEKRKCAGFN